MNDKNKTEKSYQYHACKQEAPIKIYISFIRYLEAFILQHAWLSLSSCCIWLWIWECRQVSYGCHGKVAHWNLNLLTTACYRTKGKCCQILNLIKKFWKLDETSTKSPIINAKRYIFRKQRSDRNSKNRDWKNYEGWSLRIRGLTIEIFPE